jgi:hypothetical protein
MVMNATDIKEGLDVYGSDGEKIGSVKEVYPAATGTVSTVSTGMPETISDVVTEEVPVTDAAPGTMTATGYFQVDQGGILGIGVKELYFPFSAVTNVVPGDNLTVNCTKDQCGDLYGTKPDFLKEETSTNPLS